MTENDKRKKNDALVSFRRDFTEEQKKARKLCHENVVTVLTGKPGTSKTTIAASVALELLMIRPKPTSVDKRLHKNYNQIVISRPTVLAGKEIGFIPGNLDDKMMPYISPAIEVMKELIGDEAIKKMLETERIKIVPIQFMRGRTFNESIVILDEGQNANLKDFKLISSRLGKDSKLIVTSDWRQIDLKNKNSSIYNLIELLTTLDGIDTFELTENFRHELAVKIMDTIDKYEEDIVIQSRMF